MIFNLNKDFSFIKFIIVFILFNLIIFILINLIFKNDFFQNNENDYINYSDKEFEILNSDERWNIRMKCINKFNNYKEHYKIIPDLNYILNNYNKSSILSKFNNIIFVSIASYCDPECSYTLSNLIYNAYDKHNLHIVVCQQNNKIDKEIDCMYNNKNQIKYITDILDNNKKELQIKIINLEHTEAKGPTYARYLIQKEYNNEAYYLQIDSHTSFEKNWDLKLKKCLDKIQKETKNNNIVITQYLPEYDIKNKKVKKYKVRSELKVSCINSTDGFTRILSEYLNENKNENENENENENINVTEGNAWSACFSFSSGLICKDAPIDPYTPHLFFGEEMDITLRLYTRGWLFFNPSFPIAYTNFNRNYRETFWKNKKYDKHLTLISRLRVHYRLGTLPDKYKLIIEQECPELLVDIDKFTLGKQKTLNDYSQLIEMKFN